MNFPLTYSINFNFRFFELIYEQINAQATYYNRGSITENSPADHVICETEPNHIPFEQPSRQMRRSNDR